MADVRPFPRLRQVATPADPDQVIVMHAGQSWTYPDTETFHAEIRRAAGNAPRAVANGAQAAPSTASVILGLASSIALGVLFGAGLVIVALSVLR